MSTWKRSLLEIHLEIHPEIHPSAGDKDLQAFQAIVTTFVPQFLKSNSFFPLCIRSTVIRSAVHARVRLNMAAVSCRPDFKCGSRVPLLPDDEVVEYDRLSVTPCCSAFPGQHIDGVRMNPVSIADWQSLRTVRERPSLRLGWCGRTKGH